MNWRGVRSTLLAGVLAPAMLYMAATELGFRGGDVAPTAAELLVAEGIDPLTLDLDTISPRLAARVGLKSRLPATEYVVVLISSSWCLGNEVQGFSEAVASIRALVEDQISDRSDALTRLVGVALDTDPRVGTEYLFSLAAFDEVSAGGEWLNTGTEKYLWGGMPLSGEVPLVAILEREVVWEPYLVSIKRETLLRSIVGAREIVDWVAGGARLPSSTGSSDRGQP